MDKDWKIKKIKELRTFLVKWTGGCNVQSGGFPCGTCLTSLLSELMDSSEPEYKERNKPIDRVNEVWRAILQIRKPLENE